MDTEALHVVLQQSFSPDANLRIPAEATIRNLKHVDGASVMLLQVAGEKQVSDVILIHTFSPVILVSQNPENRSSTKCARRLPFSSRICVENAGLRVLRS